MLINTLIFDTGVFPQHPCFYSAIVYDICICLVVNKLAVEAWTTDSQPNIFCRSLLWSA